MRTYASSWVKRKSFYMKSELQMFLFIGAPIWRLLTKLYKAERPVRETFQQITQKLWAKKT